MLFKQNPPQTKADNTSVLVTELPVHVDVNRIRDRLQRLSVNCGGRVVHVDLKSRTAVLRFFNADSADRLTIICVYGKVTSNEV